MIHLAELSSQVVTWHIQHKENAKLTTAHDSLSSKASDSVNNSVTSFEKYVPSNSLAIAESVAGFSSYLFKQSNTRQYPEIVALAFWFRQSHVNQIMAELQSNNITQSNKRIRRVFHIAPANVDTVFMYSVLLSVLSGNTNVVRVSKRSGDVTWLLISLLRNYLQDMAGREISPLISVLEYDARHESVTEQLSHWSDLRVIWGGDEAINSISKIAPQTTQICFPDRYSVALLQLNKGSDFRQQAVKFLADLLPFKQQACSSPKALYWLNTDLTCQHKFWREVEQVLVDGVTKNSLIHHFEVGDKIEQHILLQKLVAEFGVEVVGDVGNEIALFKNINHVGPLARCKVKALTADMLKNHSGHGLVLEKDIYSTEDIAYSERLQTISYWVDGEIQQPTDMFKRMVTMGKALEFSTTWDGTNLLQVFSE